MPLFDFLCAICAFSVLLLFAAADLGRESGVINKGEPGKERLLIRGGETEIAPFHFPDLS
jgi:hypothetical protein